MPFIFHIWQQQLQARGSFGYLAFSRDRRHSCEGCHCRNQPRFSITYYSPRWLSKSGIFVSVTHGERIHVALSMPRVVSSDPEFFRCARNGDCERMKEMLCSGMASVADISAPYGITALSMALLHSQIEVSEFLISQGVSQYFPSQDWTILNVFDYYSHASRIEYDISASATMKDYVQLSGAHWHWDSFRAYENIP